MEEISGQDKFIKCSKCKCKYINDDEHLQIDFGFNRLNVRYKCCVKCRKHYKDNASIIGENNRRRYYKPCSVCGYSVYKYQQQQLLKVCQIYLERQNNRYKFLMKENI